MYIDGVTLYYSPECPYCRRVLAFCEENDITLDKKNVLEPGVEEELEHVSGQGSFPTLMIGDEALTGSDQIIAYLQERMAEAGE